MERPLHRYLSSVLTFIDRSKLIFLALFDVGAAFDTVDHEILLKRLQLSFGQSCNFFTWWESSLDGRSLCAVHGSSRSACVPGPHDPLQGARPLLYII